MVASPLQEAANRLPPARDVDSDLSQLGSVDFVHDQLACGRRFRVLNVIDDVTKECLAAVADTSLSGKRVVCEMTALIANRGKPGAVISDNGTEFTSAAVLKFAQEQKLD